MGILDSVFAGSKGLSNSLHKTFGTQAILRKHTFVRDNTTGELVPQFVETNVYFVPDSAVSAKVSVSKTREPSAALSGTLTSDENIAPITSENDTLVLNGEEYIVLTVDVQRVGAKDCLYAITARKG